jgi:HPt (histidine-containing phosphotransfer) domain-containing protein
MDHQGSEDLVNLEHLKIVTDGDQEFEAELIHLYVEDVTNRLLQIEKLLAAETAEVLIREAHTVKGASSNVGAEGVRSIAAEIEKLAKDGQIEAAAGRYEELREAFIQTQDFFEDYIREL